jgi:hypothetical protein
MTKDMMSKAYANFCKEKGVEKMNLVEYKSHGNDVPVKDYLLRRAFGSWHRVNSATVKRHPVELAVVAPTPTPTPAPTPVVAKKEAAPKKATPKKAEK